MLERPNIHTHMAKWGLLSGTVLAVLLMTFLSSLDGFGGLIALIFPPVWILGLFFGGIPGTILGAIEASFIKQYLDDAPLDFNKDDMRHYRSSVYRAAGFVPIAMHIFLSLFVAMLAGFLGSGLVYFFVFGVPTLIASAASIYAAHRYMFRLRLHGMRLIGGQSHRKEHYYDTTRLEDGTAYETARYDTDDKRNSTHLVQG
ncbi:MAG: hypothetical protein AAF846_14055 [Chloroflexota bacterium]